MSSIRARTLLAVLALGSALCSAPTLAQERILSYHSDIDIAADASMVVTETVTVRAEGVSIQRGIYRDFPTTYTDRLGNRYRVGFEVIEVRRDGQAEPWRTENRSNGVRVYIGNANRMLEPGEYVYTIRYRTDRQMGYFENHDELYWNVTGNGWAFVIERASATVNLPEPVPADDLAMEGYTGGPGESGQAYTASVSDGQGVIQTTGALAAGEGLTLAMSWPKGVIAEPGTIERLGFLLSDNVGLLLALLAFIASGAWLYFAWSRHGRDPEGGVIFPHYEPPAGYSPASARYILRMGYDSKTLTAAIVNLAVKGHLTITQEGKKDYRLSKSTSTEALAAGEQALLNGLFKEGEQLELKTENHKILSKARTAHRKSLRRDYLNTYFKTNAILLLPSFLFSVAVLAGIAVLDVFVLSVLIVYGLIIVLHILFGFLMRAPSERGRSLLDKFEGFKLFLNVSEKDDLNLKHPPEMTPRLFERYLPFAMALGVEQAWAEKFTRVFAALESQQGISYHPAWYAGSFHHLDMDGFTRDVSSGFSTAISSAATPPGTSSGVGGGGASGGGGGGGGGGGW